MSTPTARSTLHLKRRPSSAIFVGISPVPDLPEPPSPGGTTSSGLPSPPATDSTGSGSTGDVGTTYMSSSSSAKHAPTESDNDNSSLSYDQDYDNDYDEDATARLDRLRPSSEASENVLALQRVKNLAQRNRMVLDKLNRLSSPSPGPSNRSGRSSNAPSTSSSSSSTTSRSRLSGTHSRAFSTASASASHQPLTRASLNSLSGSETERESNYSSHPYSASSNRYASSDEDLAALSTPSHRLQTPSRTRLRSAPTSPAKALTRTSRRSSPGPGARTPFRDVSIPRESFSTTSKRTRQPLPREFRDNRLSMEPVTPHRESPSPAPSNRSSVLQNINRSPRAPRFSTVRDVSKRHQSRWVSEDMTNANIREEGGFSNGRVQSTRGGSADSMLTAIGGGIGGRLVGESLRAAGISMRRDDDEEGFGTARRRLVDFSLRSSSRLDDRKEKDNEATYGRRAVTSMANYHRQDDDGEDDGAPHTAPPPRTYKGASGLLDSDRAGSSMGRYTPSQAVTTPVTNRSDLSNYGSRRFASNAHMTPGSGGGPSGTNAQDGSEHTRLMTESLAMFESQLSRLPNGLSSASVETLKNAQSIVSVAERLNSLLRAASTNALDEQVNAELAEADGDTGASERAAVWRAVGGEYREQLRASDEMVRGLTGLLLGIGKVIKESGGSGADGMHERSNSLDNDPASRRKLNASPEVMNTEAPGRRSWDPSPNSQRLMGRVDSILSGKGRPSSSLGRPDSKGNPINSPSLLSRDSLAQGEASSSHLMATPGYIRSNDRVGFRKDYEPSPTPASRNTVHHDRSQTLPALGIPPPALSPEESQFQSTLRRVSTTTAHSNTGGARQSKVNTTAPTIRGSPMSLSIPNATTAVTTHHVQNSPLAAPQPFPISRNDSKLSLSSASSSNKVTFSKPSTVSAMLNGLTERDRKRTISSSSNDASSSPRVSLPITPVSGSEAEKERRRTIGLSSKTLRRAVDGLSAPDNRPESRRESLHGESSTGTVQPARTERRRMITEIFS